MQALLIKHIATLSVDNFSISVVFVFFMLLNIKVAMSSPVVFYVFEPADVDP